MKTKSDFGWLLQRISSSRWRIVLGLLCVSFAGLAATADPLLLQLLIDRAWPQRSVTLMLELALGISLCFFARAVLSSIGSLINFSISQRCIRELRIALLDRMNRLSEDYHQQTPTGEKLARIEHDVDEIANLGADTANQSIRAILFFALYLSMMARLNFSMTLTLLPLFPLFAFVQQHYRVQLKERADNARAGIGSATSILNEYLGAVPQIQYLGAEEATAWRAVSVWDGMLHAQWIQRRTQVGFSLSMSAILALAILDVFIAGTYKIFHGVLTIGGLVAFSAYITRVFEPVSSAMDLYARLQSVGASIRRVRQLLDLEPTVPDTGTCRLSAGALKFGFVLQNVCFSYADNRVLDHISLEIKAGERIALIGASGSGKSTLARLLVRAADPESGGIQLEGRSISEFTLASLRRAVGYVPQQPLLFQGSIRENLLYGNPAATEADLQRALAAAQLASVVNQLPQGIDTPLGPGAGSLSGGERQRLALARSLLRNSSALILDESTSALDAPTETAVLSSISTFREGQTLILISHRVSSLMWVDRLVLLDRGGIAGTGSHEDLYARSALYRSLFDASADDAAVQRNEFQ
jgi:ABC-type bacteriocin/lantibiotic exporter with double-glycine peptidase domain